MPPHWSEVALERVKQGGPAQPGDLKLLAMALDDHNRACEMAKGALLLINDMVRFVGKMALQDYQALNTVPVRLATYLHAAGREVPK